MDFAIDKSRKYSQVDLENIAKMLLKLDILDNELLEGIDFSSLKRLKN